MLERILFFPIVIGFVNACSHNVSLFRDSYHHSS